MEPGGELLWATPNGQLVGFNRVVSENFRYLVVGNPSWSAADAQKADVFELWRTSTMAGSPSMRINSVDPDISAFRKRGGKLIQYHGWSDPTMSAGYATHYYMEVVDLQPGPDRLASTQKFYRLFMAPGMSHCYGGAGPTNFGALNHEPLPKPDADNDLLEALDAWVEKGHAPEQITATEFTETGDVRRQMPICAYPKVAMYVAGDPNSIKSFQCKVPAKPRVRF